MYVDFKETIFNRVDVDTDAIDEDKVVNALKDGTISTAEDLLEFILDETGEVPYNDYLIQTGTLMTLKESNGESTVLSYNGNGQLTYQNGKSCEQ